MVRASDPRGCCLICNRHGILPLTSSFPYSLAPTDVSGLPLHFVDDATGRLVRVASAMRYAIDSCLICQ